MNTITFGSVVISKGYQNSPAIEAIETKGGEIRKFRIGERVYDTREKDGYRWNNFNVVAFGIISERIEKMKLDAGSGVNITGHLDIEKWKDDQGNNHSRAVVICDRIEFALSGTKSDQTNSSNGKSKGKNTPPAESPAEDTEGTSQGSKAADAFTGNVPLGGFDDLGIM